ncbi:TetR/AcrR family transcriptional regulator C-terminal domain-containing protein [Nonomuraea solani]|nr:TetR/AcrR family transcriptional regulator C-terminal domain-containing protein [Nonomuraea solani]
MADASRPSARPKETGWTLMYFVLGLVKEEQAPPDRTLGIEAAAANPAAFPSLAETIEHLTRESFDDRFTFGVDLILTGRSPGRFGT